ncbi:MAG TPA: 4Fe-4S dicluster domain-containing protein, partial [Burkholderiales bacterium]|nr:4Fe-4S dicluster domain-containing protein [Burkholderiales bacterium]
MSAPAVKPKAMIQDNTRCIGCRACMVACKSWNDLPEDKTDFFAGNGYQNPRDLDANNYNLITFNEIVTGAKPDWVFGRQLCMHCEHPACASACPTTALNKTPIGAVVFNEDRCIGCRACMQACPFIIPKYDYNSFAPKIHKCTFCADRLEVGMDPACATV